MLGENNCYIERKTLLLRIKKKFTMCSFEISKVNLRKIGNVIKKIKAKVKELEDRKTVVL